MNGWRNARRVVLGVMAVAALVAGGTRVFGKVAATTPAATQSVKGQQLFWKVTSPTTTVYLMGSMHIAPPEIYPLSRDIEKAFKECDVLVVEVDMSKVDHAKLIKLVRDLGMYAGGDSLAKHVTPDAMKSLDDYCAAAKIPPAMFEKMKPWLAEITLAVLADEKTGMDPALGLEKHFTGEAKGKEIVELESVEGQLKMLAERGEKEQAKSLAISLKQLTNIPAYMRKMVQAWKTGDEKSMEGLLQSEMGTDADAKAVIKTLIYDRNIKMAEKIEDMLKSDKRVFVLVGALHLVGDRGVAKLLEQKGFKVEKPAVLPGGKESQNAVEEKEGGQKVERTLEAPALAGKMGRG